MRLLRRSPRSCPASNPANRQKAPGLPGGCGAKPHDFFSKSDFSCVETPFSPGSRHCAAVLQTQVPKLCTDLNLSLFYILILGTYSKFAWENNFLALGVCFPQSCSSAGRMFAASRSRLQYYRRIVVFPQQKFR